MNLEYDVLIIGCGLSGLSAALRLAEEGVKVGIVTRESDPKISNTFYAQGGIIYHDGERKEDHELLLEDIQKASAQTSNKEIVKILAERSKSSFERTLLKSAEVNFERDENGLKLTKEAAHSRARIAYKGDFTGKEIQVSLLNYLKDKKRFPNIQFLTSHTAIDLITPLHHGVNLNQRYEDLRVVGAYVFDRENEIVKKIMAKKVILATGGIGALYLHHSNSEGARGDGHAMAKRAGAMLVNLEFVQFHPTTFYDQSAHRRFLISEALRGEGGILINSSGQRFMERYHPDMELAPRDVVARAILQEMIEKKSDCVYLDLSHKKPDWIKERFPTIYSYCLERRIDITKVPIPVVPAAHYTCGGVKVDKKSQATLKNLYAVGEVACNGLHGANRLASTSLLECLVFGEIAAEDILESGDIAKDNYNPFLINEWKLSSGDCDLALISQDWMSLKQTMWNYVGLSRSTMRLKRAGAMMNELLNEVQRFYRNSKLSDELIGLRNAIEVTNTVISSSMRNNRSLGCFYKES